MYKKNCETCVNRIGERSKYTNETCIAEGIGKNSVIICEKGEKTEQYMWCKGKKYL